MYVEKVSLLNFRNFEKLDVTLSPHINIFFGDNAQGKTNFLECIYLCATGRSHRNSADKELINFKKDFAYIKAFLSNKNIIDVHLKNNQKKGIAINSIPIKKLGDLYGVMLVVVFSPEDLRLIKSGPSERRRFMDTEICQISNIYYYELKEYYKVLKQRNHLLKKIQTDKSLIDSLEVWDSQLISHGIKIIKFREEFIQKINIIANSIHKEVTNGLEELSIIYKPYVSIKDFEAKLNKNNSRDIFLGTTNVGIHKDDISFFINNIDTRVYGSQGQQRTASLSTKLAEIELIKQEKNSTPILLLDDVFSELDESRQLYLLKTIKSIQTIITCTGVLDILNNNIEKSLIFKVKNGQITLNNDSSVV